MGKYQKPRGVKLKPEVIEFLASTGHCRTVMVGDLFREQESYFFLPQVFKKDRDGNWSIVHIQNEFPGDFSPDRGEESPKLITSINNCLVCNGSGISIHDDGNPCIFCSGSGQSLLHCPTCGRYKKNHEGCGNQFHYE